MPSRPGPLRRPAGRTRAPAPGPGHGDPGPIQPASAPFVDARGEILNLLNAPCGSVLVISSAKGALRGNHYHKTDYHYAWLQRGGLVYFHRPVGARTPPQRWVIKPGEMVYTPPEYEHAMQFTEESVLFVFARNHRGTQRYEQDTVRIPLVEGAAAP